MVDEEIVEKKEGNIWMRQALEDLSSAKAVFNIGKYYVVAFLCEQAVEKGLKALWISRGNDLVRTHDLVKLAKDVGLDEKYYKELDSLSGLHIKSRYVLVDSDEIPSEIFGQDVESFIKLVEEVLEWIKEKI